MTASRGYKVVWLWVQSCFQREQLRGLRGRPAQSKRAWFSASFSFGYKPFLMRPHKNWLTEWWQTSTKLYFGQCARYRRVFFGICYSYLSAIIWATLIVTSVWDMHQGCLQMYFMATKLIFWDIFSNWQRLTKRQTSTKHYCPHCYT